MEGGGKGEVERELKEAMRQGWMICHAMDVLM